jgi:hypothetical protein
VTKRSVEYKVFLRSRAGVLNAVMHTPIATVAEGWALVAKLTDRKDKPPGDYELHRVYISHTQMFLGMISDEGES